MTKRLRTATESLLSITLGMEAAVVLFATITVAGLRILETWVTWVVGVALLLVFIFATRAVRAEWGVWLGHFLQLILIAAGFVHPLMFVIGAGFAGLWVYCFVTGRRLDRRNGLLDDTSKESM